MLRFLSFATLLASAVALPLSAQTTPPVPVQSPLTVAAPTAPSPAMTLTAEQATSWKDKPIYSSDDKKIGEVKSFTRAADNSVIDLQADIGGFLGIGETHVRLMPPQFKLETNRVVLALTAEQAKALPKVRK